MKFYKHILVIITNATFIATSAQAFDIAEEVEVSDKAHVFKPTGDARLAKAMDVLSHNFNTAPNEKSRILTLYAGNAWGGVRAIACKELIVGEKKAYKVSLVSLAEAETKDELVLTIGPFESPQIAAAFAFGAAAAQKAITEKQRSEELAEKPLNIRRESSTLLRLQESGKLMELEIKLSGSAGDWAIVDETWRLLLQGLNMRLEGEMLRVNSELLQTKQEK